MKTKFWRKSLAALLLVVLTVSAMAGFNAVPTSVKASEDLAADATTVYTLTDLGAETQVAPGVAGGKEFVYAGANVTKSLGATETTTNVSVIFDVETETPSQEIYYIGKEDTTNTEDATGYAISVWPRWEGFAIYRGTVADANLLATGSIPKTTTKLTYEIEFGIVDMRDRQGTLQGRKVYAKYNNGESEVSYIDTNLGHTVGKNVAFYANGAEGAGALVTVSLRALLKADETTVYGLTDLGAETQVAPGVAGGKEFVYAGPNVTKQLGATDSATNASVILDVSAETTAEVVYYFGKESATNVADGTGYAIQVWPRWESIAICRNTAVSENLLASVTIPKDKAYELEFGIVDMRDRQGTLQARKVFVKYNGEEVVSYLDTNLDYSVGKNVAFYANGAEGAGALVAVSPRTLKADETTVYGLTDLGSEVSVYAGPNVTKQLGATESATNASVILDVSAETTAEVVYYFGKESATNVADGTGYAIQVWPRWESIAICRNTAVSENLLASATIPKDKAYELEFGIVDMRDRQGTLQGRKVFVKYNGEEVVSYLDTNLDYSVGKNVAFYANGVEGAGAAVQLSTRTLKTDSTKIYSLYDLMGVNSVNLTTAYNLLGSTSTTSNVRMKLGIMVNFTGEFLFSLAKQTESHYDGTGYQFKINPANNWIRIHGANNDWRLVEAPLNLTGGADAIVVEFGIIDMRDSQGTLRARKVYATANGSELISYYDYNVAHPLGNNVLVKMPENTGMGTFNQAISSQVVKYDEIAEYRQADNFTSPVAPDGYVFAGWYADESCAPETALDATTVSGSAYAKFVDAKLSEVRAQISASTTAESEKADIRFLTSVDGLNYSKIGYKITAKGSTKEVGNNSVYKQLTVTLLEGESFDLAPDQVFGQQANYFKAYVIKNIPNVDFNENIEVTPYWITLDGTTVYGTTAVKTVAQGIEAE